MPPSNITSMSAADRIGDLRQRRDRRRRAVELAAAVIGNDERGWRRSWPRCRASSTSRMPLRMSLPGHRLLTHSTSFQFSVGSNWLAVHCASELTFSMPRTWPARLPKVLRLPLRISSAQAGLVAMSMRLRELDLRRHRHAVADVAMALAEHLQVDREHQRAAFGRDGALDQRRARSRGPASRRAGTRTACRPPPPRPRSSRSTWWTGVNGMPAACAARQARISPSPCCMPQSPIGASASGSAACSPMMVVRQARAATTSTSTRWRSLMCSRSSRLARSVSSRIGAGLGVVEEGARHPAAGRLPQILDAGHGAHGHRPCSAEPSLACPECCAPTRSSVCGAALHPAQERERRPCAARYRGERPVIRIAARRAPMGIPNDTVVDDEVDDKTQARARKRRRSAGSKSRSSRDWRTAFPAPIRST